MIRLSVEVGRGTARYKVAVQAESIRRALQIAGALRTGGGPRVTLAIDPEASFVGDLAAAAGSVEREKAAKAGEPNAFPRR